MLTTSRSSHHDTTPEHHPRQILIAVAEMILSAEPADGATDVPLAPTLAVSVTLERDVAEAVLDWLAWRGRGVAREELVFGSRAVAAAVCVAGSAALGEDLAWSM